MFDDVINSIIELRWSVLIYSLIIIFVCAIYWLKTRKFEWKKSKVTTFALLYNLTKTKAIIIALVIGRLCFVLTCAIFCRNINISHLIVFVLFSLIILVLSKNFRLFVNNFLNSIAIFFLLFIESSLYNYYLTIENITVVLAMVIMIGVFSVLYTTLQVISTYETIAEV